MLRSSTIPYVVVIVDVVKVSLYFRLLIAKNIQETPRTYLGASDYSGRRICTCGGSGHEPGDPFETKKNFIAHVSPLIINPRGVTGSLDQPDP